MGPGAAPLPRLAWPPSGPEQRLMEPVGRAGWEDLSLPQEQNEGRSKLRVYELQGHRPTGTDQGLGPALGS